MQIIINKDYEGSRLDRFLRERFKIPQSLVIKLLREKKIKVNKKKADADIKLHIEDVLNVYYAFEELASSKANIASDQISFFQTWIIFEDENIIVINKPHGVSSQGGTKAGYAVDVLAKAYYSEARITHRLDRETSGIMVLAKNKLTAREITQMFASGLVQKKYYAVVHGTPNNEGKIITDLQKNASLQKIVASEGNSAITYYKNTKTIEGLSLLEVIPKTGKMHQIRVHLSYIGFPILGDIKYGGIDFKRMMLHSSEIYFGEYKFKCNLPDEFLEIGFI